MPKPLTIKPDPRCSIKLYIGQDDIKNNNGINEWSHLHRKIIFSAMLNKGYKAEITLMNINYELLSNLNNSGYFMRGRREPLVVKFKLSWSEEFDPKETTAERTAIVSHIIDGYVEGGHNTHQTLVAVDPTSYYLSIGDAFGGVWTGKIEEVIKKVVARYAPFITLEVSETDSDKDAQYWQMRMTPKKFIGTLLDWSPAFTKKQTRWIISPEDYKLNIKEQADIDMSEPKAFYQKWASGAVNDTVRQWTIKHNLFHALTNTNHLSFAISSSYGEYIVKNTSDSNTKNKYATERYAEFAYSKPDDTVKARENPKKEDIKGMAQVISEPELYGDFNKSVSGSARSKYYSVLDTVMNGTIEVPGHHIWASTNDLGACVVQLAYIMDDMSPHYMTGIHMVHGFRHVFELGAWHTTLNVVRMDSDASAQVKIKLSGTQTDTPNLSDFTGLV